MPKYDDHMMFCFLSPSYLSLIQLPSRIYPTHPINFQVDIVSVFIPYDLFIYLKRYISYGIHICLFFFRNFFLIFVGLLERESRRQSKNVGYPSQGILLSSSPCDLLYLFVHFVYLIVDTCEKAKRLLTCPLCFIDTIRYYVNVSEVSNGAGRKKQV